MTPTHQSLLIVATAFVVLKVISWRIRAWRASMREVIGSGLPTCRDVGRLVGAAGRSLAVGAIDASLSMSELVTERRALRTSSPSTSRRNPD